MMDIAVRLTTFMATPVSDRTGWPGLFNFDIIAGTEGMPYRALFATTSSLGAPLQTDAPQLLEVLHRELGVKLVEDRATITDFIVERVEPLIEN
jgi:uncharacterized protein (TIGR03435 family)